MTAVGEVAHHASEPAVGADHSAGRGEHHHRVSGGFYAQGDGELFARQIARSVGGVGEVEVGVLHLQGLDGCAHARRVALVDHDYLIARSIPLRQKRGQQGGKLLGLVVGVYDDARAAGVGGVGVGCSGGRLVGAAAAMQRQYARKKQRQGYDGGQYACLKEADGQRRDIE